MDILSLLLMKAQASGAPYDNVYHKPNGGIPKTDLTSDVQASLEKADTALQAHQDIPGKQDIAVPENYLATCGYENGRLSSSGAESSHAGMVRSKWIPCAQNDIVTVKGIVLPPSGVQGYICFYDESRNFICAVGTATVETQKEVYGNVLYGDSYTSMLFAVNDVLVGNGCAEGIAYLRFSCGTIDGSSSCTIIKENENIDVRDDANEEAPPVNYLTTVGYEGGRLTSSGAEAARNDVMRSKSIPCRKNDAVSITNIVLAPAGVSGYVCFYDLSGAFLSSVGTLNQGSSSAVYNNIAYNTEHTSMNFTVNDTLVGSGKSNDVAYFRFSCGTIDENSVCTIASEPVEAVDVRKTMYMQGWTKPLFDRSPTFLLSSDIEAMNGFTKSPAAVYEKYQDLCNTYPEWMTATDLGLSSDGETHIWRYDLQCPAARHDTTLPFSQTMPCALLASGVHNEYMGIYSLYAAVRQILTDPNLAWLRNNVHLIIVPIVNPYCCIQSNSSASNDRKNYRGVEIHRNFAVGWKSAAESGFAYGHNNYGGPYALSEVETRNIDAILRENHKHMVFMLSCHNFDYSAGGTTNFVWTSAATALMSNLGARLVDKLSTAWNEKYDLSAGIAKYKGDLPSWDTRLGKSGLSLTGGSEYRHAAKYGVQGLNVEVVYQFLAHCGAGTTQAEDLEAENMSSFSVSRACETYVNAIITLFANFDIHDRDKFWK